MPHVITLDETADPGQQLAPEVRAEIAEVAPSVVDNGSITTAKLADDAVTEPKVAPGAVNHVGLAVAAVESPNLATNSVTTPKLADDAVTPPKCGTGVVTAVDSASASVAVTIQYVTAAQYAAIVTKDPNTEYHISA